LRRLQTAIVLGCSFACASTNPAEQSAPPPSAEEGVRSEQVSAAHDASDAAVDVTPASDAVAVSAAWTSESVQLEPLATPGVQEPTAPPPSGPLVLDLTGAIELAIAESPDMLAAAARIDAAHAGLAQARAAYLPSLDVSLDYLRADAPSMYLFKTIDSGHFLPGTDFNQPGAFSNWEAGIGLSYNIYAGGRDKLHEEMAAEGIESEKLRIALVENALVAAVIDAWFEVRLGEEQITTARASVETVEIQLNEARVRHEEGSALVSDVLSLEVRRAEAAELEIRARTGRDLALATLAQLIGVGDDSPLQLEGIGSVPGHLPAGWDEAISRALADRPELALSRSATRVAEKEVGVAKSAILPEADLFARAWRDAPELDFDNSRDNWALGVSLRWDVFNGGRGPTKDRSRALLDERRRVERQTELAVELDVRDAWLRLESGRSRSAVASAAVAAAAETMRLVKVQYESGAATVTRFLEAEMMNTHAQLRRIRAEYDLERARANLMRAVGDFVLASHSGIEE